MTCPSDAEDVQYVYDWRLEQEAALRQAKGKGMTDRQVVDFVNGCKEASGSDRAHVFNYRLQTTRPTSSTLMFSETASTKSKGSSCVWSSARIAECGKSIGCRRDLVSQIEHVWPSPIAVPSG